MADEKTQLEKIREEQFPAYQAALCQLEIDQINLNARRKRVLRDAKNLGLDMDRLLRLVKYATEHLKPNRSRKRKQS